MTSVASEYIKNSPKWRRMDGALGRHWKSTEPPVHLYKYRQLVATDQESVDRAREILVHGRVWVADPSSLNDLHDMRFKLVLNSDHKVRRQWVKEHAHFLQKMSPAHRLQEEQRLIRAPLTKSLVAVFKAEIEEHMGVFCASQDPRNEPMWAHYAADHRGICVQLDTTQDELFLLINKVEYSSQFPTLTVPHSSEQNKEYFRFKSVEWSYEREWRVIVPHNRFSIELRPPAIAGVILGARADRTTCDAVQALNAERITLGRPAFRLYKAEQHEDRYGVRISQVRS